MRCLLVRDLAHGYAGCGLADIAVPQPAPGEALVRVRAAAVNFPDLLMTRGAYQFRPALPYVAGMEFSGEIVAVGPGTDASMLGRAVVGGGKTGAFAGFVAVAASALRDKPGRLDWPAAAAYSATYLTAWVALVRKGGVRPGEWVLVHGAGGGVGLACVDLARHLGARVIAAASTAAKRAAIEQLYHPDAVIDCSADLRDAVKACTGGRGADVIVDPVGGDMFDASTRCVAFDGRLLVLGFTSGRIPSIDANIPLIKGFSVVGVRAGEYGRRFPDRGEEDRGAIDRLVADGALRPHVHAVLPLAQWRQAFDQIDRRRVVGKIVLLPSEE